MSKKPFLQGTYDAPDDRRDFEGNDEPWLRLGGVIMLLNGLLGLVLIAIALSANPYRRDINRFEVKELIAIGADFLIGMLLWWRLPRVRWWAILRAGATAAIPLALLLFSDEPAPRLALTLTLAYLAALTLVLIGNASTVRAVLGTVIFALCAAVQIALASWLGTQLTLSAP